MREGETETELNDAWKERARDTGIVMRRPALSPNTNMAHEATAFAKDKGLDGEFHHAAAKAYWEEGVDLGSKEVLLNLGAECGLDTGELSAALDSGQYREYVLGEHQAAKDLGVFGTPTYKVNEADPDFGDKSVDEMTSMIEGGSN